MGIPLETSLPKLIIYIYLLLFVEKPVSCEEECIPGVKSIGYTVPKGDVVVEYGNPLDIYCILYEEEARKVPNASQNLIFLRDSELLNGEMVQIINSTTVKLHVENPGKAKQQNYMCIFKNVTAETSVCLNVVYVGVPPQPVTDFRCISNNLNNLTCKWTAPENYVSTDYNLSYSVKRNTRYNCPKIEESDRERSCMWNLSTDPIYRQSVPDYFFYLNMSNVFGNASMPRKHFKHFEHVRPNAPENLKLLGITWNSVNLSWTVPTTMQTFSKGLYHRILYQSSYGKKEWQTRTQVFTKDLREVIYNLDNLKYAHAYYDIRIAMRSAVADKKDKSMWSNYSSITVLTASKKPDSPPKTTIGSFEILTYGSHSERNVRIYWSHIEDENKNGREFNYVVGLEGRDGTNTTPSAYMLFERLSGNRSYTFRIWSRNEMGSSDRYSVVQIPAEKDYIRGPAKLIKEELGGGHYRLSWQRPTLEASQRIENYTIFWCNDERDKPPCSGKLDWAIIPAELHSFNKSIPSNNTYQFGISANTLRGSSGMVWAQCTDSYHKYSVGKINAFSWVHFGSNFIQLKWEFGCSDRSVTGFIIYYCPIKSPTLSDCKGSPQNITVPSDKNFVTIGGLRPYTTYSTQVAAIINHTTYSPPSNKIQSTTLEAAPNTPPTNLRVTNVTNSTITISWEPPAVTNGVLKRYKIFYNNETKLFDPTTSVTLTNLISYNDYMITVQACTTDCSALSETLHVQTKIGYPSATHGPTITQNATYTGIKWDKPQEPNGRNDRYELRIKEKHDSENITSVINTTDREWGIYNCGKEKKYNSFYVSVRAVNIDDDKIYPGKWSDEIEYYCTSSSNYIIYILVPAIILFLLAMTYLFKKIYGHFEEMRDVGVKLPQGLQGEVTETEINLSNWTQKPGNDDGDHHAADDEEHLLMKKNEGSPNLNGDSSGCSSARDGSVTCSIDSASNISSSTSDSGTEQPRTPSTEDLTEVAVTTSLRQRNIRPSSICKPYVALPLDPSNSSGTKLAARSYCMLGVDPTVNTESGSTYIPLPLMGDKPAYNPCESPHSPPYVLTGELVKTQNPNYIPYKASLPSEVSTKNPAYVIAGNTDLLSPDVMSIESKQPITSQDSAYVKIADNMALKNADIASWQPPLLSTNTKTGYVSIGDAPPIKKESKGYVPHRQFESKALKED